MKKLAIFDLDGTLLNTITDLAICTNYALSQCGHPTHPISEYDSFVGHGINNLFMKALPEKFRTDKEIQRMRSFFIPYYNIHNIDNTVPFQGIPTVLSNISKAGYQIGIASNKYQEATEKLINNFFPDTDFVSILGQREGNPIKPDPKIIYQICSRTAGVPSSQVVYIGDSDVDVETAANAGVTVVAVTWGFQSRESLKSLKPDYLVDTTEQLEEILLSLCK